MQEYVEQFQQKYSTALLADAAFRAGADLAVPPPGLRPLDYDSKVAGPVATVEANNDLVAILTGLHAAPAGYVLVIANKTGQVGLIGDLVAEEARRRKLAGIVVDGLIRDAAAVREIGLPVFCRGVWPVGPLKLPAALKGTGEINVPLRLGDAQIQPGDWLFGDDDGVIVIGADALQAVFDWAERSWRSEESLARQIRQGEALGDLLAIQAFVEKRATNPQANFNEHLAELGRAI